MNEPAMQRTTLELLDDWHRGDKEALVLLVERHAAWLRRHVSRKMSRAMRRFETSEDVVQTVLMNLLRFGPAFRPENEAQFRGLIAKAVFNRLSDLHDYVTAEQRASDKEERLPSVVSHIGVGVNSSDRPERQNERSEERAFVALGLQLIDPDDQRVIKLHEFQGVQFAEIGKLLSISEDAARHRFHRAVARLGDQVRRLKLGMLDDLIRELEEPQAPGSAAS